MGEPCTEGSREIGLRVRIGGKRKGVENSRVIRGRILQLDSWCVVVVGVPHGLVCSIHNLLVL